MASFNRDEEELEELAGKLNLEDAEAENAEASEKAKSKKKPKKKKPASKGEASGQCAEFYFSAGRASLIKVGHHEVKGRTLVAASSLPAGTLYFSEQAVATVSHSNELCVVCGKATSVCGTNVALTDPALPGDLFCSASCRDSLHTNTVQYRYHQLLSQNISQIATSHSCDKDLLRMVFRLLALTLFPTTTDSTAEEALCRDNGTTLIATLRGVNTLEPHLEQQPATWLSAVSAGLRAVVDVLLTDADISSAMDSAQLSAPSSTTSATASTAERITQYALFLACIVNVNAYGIVDYASASSHAMGFGLFPAVGLCVNHACLPNSYFAYNTTSGCMEYRTLRTVPAGEELTVSYTDIFVDTPQRRAALYEKRFFLCQCSRCTGYDTTETATINIHKHFSTTGSAGAASKKKKSKEEEAARALLCPYYRPGVGSSGADAGIDALLDEWADEPAPKAAKGKSKANKSNTADSAAAAAAVASGTSGGGKGSVSGAEGTNTESVLADAMLSGLHCEACGTAGVIVATTTKGAESFAACIVCTVVVDASAVTLSLERCRSQWTVCQDTVRYAVPGPACATLIEKFLQEADPMYAAYTSCTLSGAQGSGGGAPSGAGAGTGGSAQAVAMERRRRAKCPVQLHAQHAILAEAFMLLYDHMWVQYKQAEQSGSGTAATSATLARVLYCLRRALHTKRSLLRPTAHPEVAATQFLLASVLQTAIRHGTKGSAVVKELRKECVEVLNEVVTARSNVFGKEHGLTSKAKAPLQAVDV